MILRLGESGNFIFAKHHSGFSVEIGVARSTGLYYYQIRTVNAHEVWSNVIQKNDCTDFEEAFEKAQISVKLVSKGVGIGFHSLEVMELTREEFEQINWEEEFA